MYELWPYELKVNVTKKDMSKDIKREARYKVGLTIVISPRRSKLSRMVHHLTECSNKIIEPKFGWHKEILN